MLVINDTSLVGGRIAQQLAVHTVSIELSVIGGSVRVCVRHDPSILSTNDDS